MFIICVIYVQSTYMLCYVILCYAMVGCCAVSCLKNFSAQSDSVHLTNKTLELELGLELELEFEFELVLNQWANHGHITHSQQISLSRRQMLTHTHRQTDPHTHCFMSSLQQSPGG